MFRKTTAHRQLPIRPRLQVEQLEDRWCPSSYSITDLGVLDGTQHALLRRIVHAAQIDTVVDTRLIVDSATAPARVAHEANVIGTMNILAACSGPDSPVRKFVFKS